MPDLTEDIVALRRAIELMEIAVSHTAALHPDKPGSAGLMRKDVAALRRLLVAVEGMERVVEAAKALSKTISRGYNYQDEFHALLDAVDALPPEELK